MASLPYLKISWHLPPRHFLTANAILLILALAFQWSAIDVILVYAIEALLTLFFAILKILILAFQGKIQKQASGAMSAAGLLIFVLFIFLFSLRGADGYSAVHLALQQVFAPSGLVALVAIVLYPLIDFLSFAIAKHDAPTSVARISAFPLGMIAVLLVMIIFFMLAEAFLFSLVDNPSKVFQVPDMAWISVFVALRALLEFSREK